MYFFSKRENLIVLQITETKHSIIEFEPKLM